MADEIDAKFMAKEGSLSVLILSVELVNLLLSRGCSVSF